MSETKNAPKGTAVAAEVKGFGIVAAILRILKMDDEGKIGKFFAKEVKKFENAIRDLNNNIAAITNVYQSALETRNDAIEDAKEAVDNAYQAVTVEDVANNATMESFASRYWASVERANAVLDRLEKEATAAAEAHEKALKVITDQIAKYQARIDKIKA